MVGKLGKFALGAAFAAVAAFGTSAQALTINQALASVQGQTGVAGPITFNFNDLSVADYFDLDSSGTITAGDVVLGAVVIDEITSSAGATGTAPLTDVSGVYALEVVSAPGGPAPYGFAPLSPGADVAIAGLTGTAPSTILAPGEMFAVYQGGLSTNPNVNPASGSFYAPAFTDGDLYAKLAPTAGYTIFFTGDIIAALAGLTPGTSIGSIIPGSDQVVVDGGLGDGGEGIGQLPLFPIGINPGQVDLTGSVLTSSAAGSVLPGAAAVFDDTATFQITTIAVPLPPAVLAGLPLLGFVVRRTIKKKNA